ncbi:MAG: ribosomal protein S18-alanine N-acetyltransferase [Anaerolineae bacterium]|nr:ribosomal protein S18-alanine N-acetyltransferase [Anaerolineae bacterium]
MSPKPDLTLRYMTLADVPQVTAIDRLSFDLPWSERSYAYEINESEHSFMVVLEASRELPIAGWRRLLGLNGGTRIERRIVGYGGLWNIGPEAHISTIAVHPQARGRGWGEVLLLAMMRRALALRAVEVVLEVRVSNERAQNLYRKHHFRTVGVKQGYYRNNDEDAYDMRLNIENAAARQQIEASYQALYEQHGFHDSYTRHKPPG